MNPAGVGGDVGVGGEAAAAAPAGVPLLLQAAFDHAPIGMAVVDGDGRCLRVNRAQCTLLGRSEDEVLGRVFLDWVHPDDADDERRRLRDLVAGRITQYEADSRRIRPDGTEVTVHERVSVALGPTGTPLVADGRGRPTPYIIRQLVDVTQERALAAALEDAQRGAVAASAAKSEFLSRVSHELRTPLSAVVGYAELLGHDRAGFSPAQQEAVGQIAAAGRHLGKLVDDLLDLTRAEQGRLELAVGPVDVPAVVDEVAGMVRAEAAAAGLTLSVDAPPPGCPPVDADRTRLAEILLNLLSNAVKFTAPGGTVRLSARPRGHRVDITVDDSGPGLSAEEQQRLFQPFERLDAAQRGIPGTGLGLALSRHLAEAMGADLSLRSRPGAGTRVTVSLRRATAPARPAEPAPPTRRPAPHTVLTGRRWSVLYIEDNAANARLVDAILARFTDAELTVATTGRAGLERAAAGPPDVVLLDLGLPDLGGEEVLARLRASPATAGVPVVVVSAEAAPRTAEALLRRGADAFLTKPIVVGDFLDTLAGVLAGR